MKHPERSSLVFVIAWAFLAVIVLLVLVPRLIFHVPFWNLKSEEPGPLIILVSAYVVGTLIALLRIGDTVEGNDGRIVLWADDDTIVSLPMRARRSIDYIQHAPKIISK